jgi:hypothetical protein
MNEERRTLSEAASLLGITPDALRQRIRRGRYHTEKEAGRVYVYLDSDRTQTERPTEQGTDVLIAELRARIESLERQLDLEREANRENHRLLAAALERVPPQLEAPSSSTGEEGHTQEDAPPAAQEARTAKWYQRWFR